MYRNDRLRGSTWFVMFFLSLIVAAACHAEQDQSTSSAPELEGFADIHVHQMAHLGFGGSIVWGYAGEPGGTLGAIPSSMRRGHDGVEGATHGHFVPVLIRTLTNAFLGDWFRHGEEGSPDYTSWPSVNRWTHQQVYKDWLFRAYQGGLRLMVMLAASSEDQFGRGEDEIPLIPHHAVQAVKANGRTGNDMESLDWQIRAAYLLQAEIDQENGGPGKGWYRIVRDPEEAGKIISEGKLAVILGTELQHLFNCDMDRPACNHETVIEGLNRLEAMGVNYVFPIHHKLNQFGGPAKFSFANNGPSGKCPDHKPQYQHDCSAVGLTDLGRFLVEELSARGMLIDTEHLGYKSFDDAMDIVERRHYPVLAGHVVPFDLAPKSERTERAKTKAQIQRILNVDGIVAPMLGTSVADRNPGGPNRIAIHCRTTDGGGVDQWANAYLFVRDLAGEKASGHILLGSDWNGFAGWPGPRDSCAPKDEKRVRYPYPLPPGLKRAAIQPVSEMTLFRWPDGAKTWDFNQVGAAHIGMLPDFLHDVELLNVTPADLEPIYRSARGVANLWTSARNRTEPWSRHHLRWAPQSAFDVFDFAGAYDGSRTVEVRPDAAICRSRTGHKLGFLSNGSCELVEPGPEENRDPVEVTAYYDGRCLTVDLSGKSGAVQSPCQNAANQKWYFRSASPQHARIENGVTRQCLTSKAGKSGYAITVVQAPCSLSDLNQEWRPERSGNTFQLIGLSGQCLEVKDQSRADGAEIREGVCTGASNQLWSVEALRQNDYETLYQADKQRYAWLPAPAASYPYAVEVDDGKQVCRAADALWLGIVYGQQCIGKTYGGQPAATMQYQGLYQAP